MNLSLTRRDPFRTSVFPSFVDFDLPRLSDFLLQSLSEDEGLAGVWTPPVDIREEADRIVVTAELPGFRESQLSIRLENNVLLTIAGERKFERDKSNTRVERLYGRFIRSFALALPMQVDRENSHASVDNGLLTIEVPKTKEAQPRRIPIGSGKQKEREKKSLAV